MTRYEFWRRMSEAMLTHFTAAEEREELKNSFDKSPVWKDLSQDVRSWASRALPALLNLARQALAVEGNSFWTLPKCAAYKAVDRARESFLKLTSGKDGITDQNDDIARPFEEAYETIDVRRLYDKGIAELYDENGRLQVERLQGFTLGAGLARTAWEQASIASLATYVAGLFSGASPEVYRKLLYLLLFGVALFYDARHFLYTEERVYRELTRLRNEVISKNASIGQAVVEHFWFLDEAMKNRGGDDLAPYELGLKKEVLLREVDVMSYEIRKPVKHYLELWDKRIMEDGCRRPDREELARNIVYRVEKTNRLKHLAKATIAKYWPK